MTAAAAQHEPAPRPFADATPAQVRAALISEEAVEFDRQWRAAMAAATESLDLTGVLALLESWRKIAWLTASAGPEAHRRMYRRAASSLTGREVPADEPLRDTKARLGL